MVAAVETMAYAGETPWHGLGKRVHADLTPQQMMVESGTDWGVQLLPTFSEIVLPGSTLDNPKIERVQLDKFALVRDSDNKVLDVVGNGWHPVQNAEAFHLFHDFVDAGSMEMHTAGSLSGGQIVWALAKVNQSFDLFKGDQVDSYLLFSNPHKYGWTINVMFTPIRVVCQNTLRLSLSSSSSGRVKQSHRSVFDPDAVKDALGLADIKLQQYRTQAKNLGSKQYTDDSVKKYLDRMFPVLGQAKKKKVSKSAARAYELLETQPGADHAKGSWWQAFNAVTYLIDHEAGRNADNRMTSAWYGAGAKVKTDALSTALKFAEAA